MKRLLVCVPLLFVTVGLCLADSTLQQSFESRSTLWQAGNSDAPFQELQHDLTTQTAHSGQKSEHIKIQAEQGTYVYYYYPVGRASFIDGFQAKLWVKGNRPGAQLLVRLVLPKERDAKQLDQPLTTLLRGDIFQLTGRWEQLQLQDPMRKLREQQQLLRAEMGRDLNFEGAFVDQIIVNVMGGPGLNEVWLDDLEVSPVTGAALDARGGMFTTSLPRVPNSGAGEANPAATRHAVIEFSQDRLLVNKQPFLVRGVRHAGSPVKVLGDAGFNTLWLEGPPEQRTLGEAAALGFWLIPELGAAATPGKAAAFQPIPDLAERVKNYPQSEAVLSWQIGTNLTAESAEGVYEAGRILRANDPYQGRPVGGTLWDGFRPYSRSLDLVGVYRFPFYTGLELDDYWDWLETRGNLGGSGMYLWTWIQTHPPEWLLDRLRDQGPPGAETPTQTATPSPQPEQIKLQSYIALAAGCRGLGFWLDRPLTDDPSDRARFLSLALVNQELKMLEPMLATLKQVTWTVPNPKNPELRLALLRFDSGLLAIPLWLGKGSQFTPSQLAMNNLVLTIPGAPQDAQAWELSPVAVRPLHRERVPGGMRVKVPEFGMTTAILFTADFGQIGKLQQSVAQSSKTAAQWSYDLALLQLGKVERIDKQLTDVGHGQSTSGTLLAEAKKHLQLAHDAWQRGGVTDYRITYEESQRAGRAIRLLMRTHWQHAVGGLDYPTASPFALCFDTLPQHYRLLSDVRATQALPSVLEGGGFEAPAAQPLPGWALKETTLDGVRMRADRVTDDPRAGSQCLKLEITPGEGPKPAALERTFLAIESPKVQLKPGTLVRVSGWIKIPQPVQATGDGALFFDSCGGEPMAVRLKGNTAWKQFSLYRRVPGSGEISVTLGLTGLGVVYFDDVKIEPLLTPQEPGKATTVSRPAKIEFDD